MKNQRLQRAPLWFYDRYILFTFLLLLCLGLLMVTSASLVISEKQFGYPFHYLIRQVIYVAAGLLLVWGVARLPLRLWQQYSGYLVVLSLFLLLLVLVPGIGRVVNGSRRWIGLGVVSLQVSELAKLTSIIYLASYLQRRHKEVQGEIMAFIKPMIVLSLLGVLLLMEPDFGAVAVLTITFLALLFLAGVRLWPFFLLVALAATALGLLAVLSPYRMQRLTTFLNPWLTQFGSGYQLTQSLIAFGRGGIFGVGLGNSIQKLFYLPEAHTDFLFAVLGEELGLIGELLVVGLFVGLIGRVLVLAKHAFKLRDLFPAYLASGFAFWLGLQSMINMGVSTGVLPTKGLTLPFISYGGSSMLINCIVIGILFRISYELLHGKKGL